MPSFDGTGPLGRGRRFGRRMGYCNFGAGFGRGFGRVPFACPAVSKKDYRNVIKEEEQYVVKYLEDLRAEIKDLDKEEIR